MLLYIIDKKNFVAIVHSYMYNLRNSQSCHMIQDSQSQRSLRNNHLSDGEAEKKIK